MWLTSVHVASLPDPACGNQAGYDMGLELDVMHIIEIQFLRCLQRSICHAYMFQRVSHGLLGDTRESRGEFSKYRSTSHDNLDNVCKHRPSLQTSWLHVAATVIYSRLKDDAVRVCEEPVIALDNRQWACCMWSMDVPMESTCA